MTRPPVPGRARRWLVRGGGAALTLPAVLIWAATSLFDPRDYVLVQGRSELMAAALPDGAEFARGAGVALGAPLEDNRLRAGDGFGWLSTACIAGGVDVTVVSELVHLPDRFVARRRVTRVPSTETRCGPLPIAEWMPADAPPGRYERRAVAWVRLPGFWHWLPLRMRLPSWSLEVVS